MRYGRVAFAAGIVLCATGCGRQVAVPPAPAPAVETKAAKPAAKPTAAPQRTTPKPAAAPAKPATAPAKVVKPAPAPAVPAKTVKPAAPAAAKSVPKPDPKPVVKPLPRKLVRPVKVDSLKLEAEFLREHAAGPLAWVLARRSGNPEVAERAAAAVLFEADRLHLSPSFLAAVLMIENAPMDPTAESVAGAIGLMQVMPVHSGGWGCPEDLEGVEVNICHGARLLHMYLRRYRTTEMALRKYNGCVGTRVTRSCLRYPARVLRIASRIRREVLQAPIAAIQAAEPETKAPPPFLRRPEPAVGADPDSVRAALSLVLDEFAAPSKEVGQP